jgi:hypothetical protein
MEKSPTTIEECAALINTHMVTTEMRTHRIWRSRRSFVATMPHQVIKGEPPLSVPVWMAAFMKRQHSRTCSPDLNLTLLYPGLETWLRIDGWAVQDRSALDREP